MLRLLLPFLTLALVNAQVCDKSENDPVTQLNYFGCNNAGRCEGSRRTRCVCCNPTEESNWCFGSTTYPHPFVFSGTTCTTVTFFYAVTFGWRFVNDEGKTPTEFTCGDMLTSPPGVGGRGTPTNPLIQDQVMAALTYPLEGPTPEYTGIVFPAACQTCRPANPCQFAGVGSVTDAMTAGFASEYNTYYDPSCATGQIDTPTNCAANTDLGLAASASFTAARGNVGSNDMLLTRTLNAVLEGNHPKCGGDITSCLSWTDTQATIYLQNDVSSQRINYIITTDSPTPTPTEHPTDPTAQPTAVPTMVPDKCFKYINRLYDLQFIGSAENCRAGLNDEWPGGKTCDSPYVICLPEANTPANPDPTEQPNIGQTLPAVDYTIEECAEECAYDQRCLGFELRPAAGKAAGECMLIDDIPVEMTNQGQWPNIGADADSAEHIASGLAVMGADIANTQCCTGDLSDTFGVSLTACQNAAYANQQANYMSHSATIAGGACHLCRACNSPTTNPLYTSNEITGRRLLGSPANFDMIAPSTALCYAKLDYCNPYFEASDLNEEMLNCYCPNNRKGTYTKKVKRTIPNTRYCGGDAATSERIRQAQANRMFHLCENWCLFETHNPMTESWYWDPWKTCWREQYAGVGTHRSYCNRVIRDPMTIEQQFINKRSDMFCEKNPDTGEIIKPITEEPTGQPSTFSSTWYLSADEESCDDACDSQGKMCDEGLTASLVTGQDTALNNAMTEAGDSCASIKTATEGWAAPAVFTDGTCLLRHPGTEYTGCNWAVGVGYRRLCACYTP